MFFFYQFFNRPNVSSVEIVQMTTKYRLWHIITPYQDCQYHHQTASSRTSKFYFLLFFYLGTYRCVYHHLHTHCPFEIYKGSSTHNFIFHFIKLADCQLFHAFFTVTVLPTNRYTRFSSCNDPPTATL